MFNKHGIEKFVHRSKTDCPDCGHVLVWVRLDKKNYTHLVTKNKGKNK